MTCSGFNNPIELPSLEKIAEMDKQRQDAINSLDISDNKAKCQQCSTYFRIVGKIHRPKNDRISVITRRIRFLENYPYGNIKLTRVSNS